MKSSFIALSALLIFFVVPVDGLNVVEVQLTQGQQLVVPSGTPSIVQDKAGFLTGVIQVQGEQPTIESDLANFVSSSTRQDDGTFILKFDGIQTNQTNFIKLLDSSGQVVYSIILTPQVEEKPSQDSSLIIPIWVYGLGAVTGCGVIGFVWWHKQGEED